VAQVTKAPLYGITFDQFNDIFCVDLVLTNTL
jgi:hypothetical protein